MQGNETKEEEEEEKGTKDRDAQEERKTPSRVTCNNKWPATRKIKSMKLKMKDVSWAGDDLVTGKHLFLYKLGCHLRMDELLVALEKKCEKWNSFAVFHPVSWWFLKSNECSRDFHFHL